MAPRRYSGRRRDDAMALTRQKIVEAVVNLHAERGAIQTSYATIAAKADVAVPTVYKHFPNLSELFNACIGHGDSLAPKIDPQEILRAPDPDTRITAMVRMLFDRYRFLARWLRWFEPESHLVPELAPHRARMAGQHRALIGLALGPDVHPTTSALAETLTAYSSWNLLANVHGLGHEEAINATSRALCTIVAQEQESDLAVRPNLNPGSPT